MKVAISFRLKSFINSRCFDQVLNRQWYGTLDQTTNHGLLSKISFIINIISFGLFAPFSLNYRNDYIDDTKEEKVFFEFYRFRFHFSYFFSLIRNNPLLMLCKKLNIINSK